MTRLPAPWFAFATIFLVVGLVGGTKIWLRFLVPEETWLVPYYAIAFAAAVLIPGLPDSSLRGLIATAIASSIGAISLVALAVLRDPPRWDLFVFALPITIIGAVGLAMLAHGILHAAPGVARLGFQAIVTGYGASIALAIIAVPIIKPFITVRTEVRGTDPATIGLIAVSLLCVVVAALIVVVGLKRLDAKA